MTGPNLYNKVTSAEEILQWIESKHTLHGSIEFLYIVTGYQLIILHDDNPSYECIAPTIAEACIIAMKAGK